MFFHSIILNLKFLFRLYISILSETIAYCKKNGIVYEAYGALKGCPWSDARLAAIASSHKKSIAQVCLRWVIQSGAIIAAGTGSNTSTVGDYAKENLDVYGFELSDSDMLYLTSFAK